MLWINHQSTCLGSFQQNLLGGDIIFVDAFHTKGSMYVSFRVSFYRRNLAEVVLKDEPGHDLYYMTYKPEEELSYEMQMLFEGINSPELKACCKSRVECAWRMNQVTDNESSLQKGNQ